MPPGRRSRLIAHAGSTVTLRTGRRRIAVAAVSVGVAVGIALAAALALGAVSVVSTNGVSMNPTYHEGDLVIVAAAKSYRTGQIVAYRDHRHHLTVLHRIIVADPAGYQLKGDNNASVDAVQPSQQDVIGRAVLHVPHLGGWLRKLFMPIPLTLFAAVLLTVGRAATRRRRRRRQPMARHASGTVSTRYASTTLAVRAAAAAGAAVGFIGLLLGAAAWTTPVERLAPTAAPTREQVTFSYDAAVRRTAAYDGTTVRAPDPVFRTLTDVVDVRIGYQGGPADLSVTVELATANGWHATVPLTARTTVAPGRLDSTVRLNLPALEQRAQAAAAVTGMPSEQLTLAIHPHVVRDSGTSFTPTLLLRLTPAQLSLVGDSTSLTVRDPAKAEVTAAVPATMTMLGQSVPVATGRAVAVALLVLALLAAGAVLLPRRASRVSEGEAIRRRYAPLLLAVHPMASVAGRPVVDVTTFAALAKLAERYGLLVLHWTRSDVETFIVHDQDSTFRYRVAGPGASAIPAISDAALAV